MKSIKLLISLSTKCWWDLKKKIPAGTYERCSATTMASKKIQQVIHGKQFIFQVFQGILEYLSIWDRVQLGRMVAL